MVEIRPLQIVIGREEDGRRLASVLELPAGSKAKAIALQVLIDIMESGDELPKALRVLFAA